MKIIYTFTNQICKKLNILGIISIIIICFYSCSTPKRETSVSVNDSSEVFVQYNSYSSMNYNLSEFEYKGHTYISCPVAYGISMTHAGHCSCNKKQ